MNGNGDGQKTHTNLDYYVSNSILLFDFLKGKTNKFNLFGIFQEYSGKNTKNQEINKIPSINVHSLSFEKNKM